MLVLPRDLQSSEVILLRHLVEHDWETIVPIGSEQLLKIGSEQLLKRFPSRSRTPPAVAWWSARAIQYVIVGPG